MEAKEPSTTAEVLSSVNTSEAIETAGKDAGLVDQKPTFQHALVFPRPGVRSISELPEDDPLREAAEAARIYAQNSKASNTKLSYEKDWKHFERWCESMRVPSMPTTATIVALYIAQIAKGWNEEGPKKASTILRRLAAINFAHKAKNEFMPASQKYPEISLVLSGILRVNGAAQTGKQPVSAPLIKRMLAHSNAENAIMMARDKAVMLLGLAGAFRRSELAGVRFEDITWHNNGMTIKIERSKTDQIGKGREVEIPYGSNPKTCPVMAVENWIAIAGLDKSKPGPLLRPVRKGGLVGSEHMNPASISYIVRKLSETAGLNNKKENKHLYSGHSLRAGFVTAAAAGGATDRQIMRQTGHKSVQMVDRYSRRDQLDRREAAQKVGL
jgi:integrase